jgi:hypothetical protein
MFPPVSMKGLFPSESVDNSGSQLSKVPGAASPTTAVVIPLASIFNTRASTPPANPTYIFPEESPRIPTGLLIAVEVPAIPTVEAMVLHAPVPRIVDIIPAETFLI